MQRNSNAVEVLPIQKRNLTSQQWTKFYEDLRSLINKHSIESTCNTSDDVLAQFMQYSLMEFCRGVNKRDDAKGDPLNAA